MSFEDCTIKDFTKSLASKEPVPGGGGAAGLVGAVGIALGNMVGSLTVGKKTYAAVEEEIRGWMEEARELRGELLAAMDEDAEAFLPLSKAYGIPKDDPDREEIMEEALRTACKPPLDLMWKLCRAVELLEGFAEKGSRIALSDAGVGAACCEAALKGAALNIFINTKSMSDRAYAEALNGQTEAMLADYAVRADNVYNKVLERIKK